MNWKQHAPLSLATATIVLTLAICTWSINRQIRLYSSAVDGYQVANIDRTLEAIEKNTGSIDQRLMTPGERLNYMLQNPPR